MALDRFYVDMELNDGRTLTERVLLADKMQFERTATTRGWDAEKSPFLSAAFWGWHAAKRNGRLECTFEEFTDSVCADVNLRTDNGEIEDGADPTRPQALRAPQL